MSLVAVDHANNSVDADIRFTSLVSREVGFSEDQTVSKKNSDFLK